jgi:mRNA interferase YafQ
VSRVAKARPKTPKATQSPLPPLILETTTLFDRDVKRQEKRGKSLDKLRAVIETLRNRRALEVKHKDHLLSGDWKRWRDCHLEPDWILIYRKDQETLVLGRTGSHSDLFE